jgi:uncharacterized glyoxalase superfamily protein PhnB
VVGQDPWPRAIPMPTYENVDRASAWLCRVFGFIERQRFSEDDGTVSTAILETPGGGVIMLGWAGPEYQAPLRHRQSCDAARRWHEVPWVVDGVLVSVDDVDDHYRRARAAGAEILTPPEDTPNGRIYRVEDLEGHRWMFSHPAD